MSSAIGTSSASATEAAHKPVARIFVVDDEEMVGLVVQDVLELQGYDSVLFQDPEAALQAFVAADPKPCLLLTDFVMKPFNGMELIERCRQHDPTVKTILYSGTMVEDIFSRHTSRPDYYLSKPFLPRTLMNAVQKVLGKL